ncbi:uncharacterized protein LOC132729844 isoform X2 [Ruditapes philippinarum]|nr:uncharacterized protein LOC132729844 isoform X2 [Ruditapes philippinarum]XP_060571660.1 uncharacterized protein LOC132729844 isoform X2 [Ruditapes philippinarum]XP_060571662.1 uncharacterized protein LOC132729844 isoform X2 [Ruditapes philippinarum]
MHGAASPFAWQGLSPYDVYQQAAQGLQPPAVLSQLPAHSHLPPMQSVMNPRLPLPWINPDLRTPTSSMDSYLHKLQEMNGFPSRSMFETSQGATDVPLPGSLPAFHSLSDRYKTSNDLYSSIENGLYKHDHLDTLDSSKEKMRHSSNSSQHTRRDLPSLPFLPHMSAGEVNTHSMHSSEAFSHLKWKNAYLPPASTSGSMSLNVSSQSTTSADLMPVPSTAASVIPYYSKPRDIDTYSMPNGLLNDAASKEAARILEEANLSNMKSGFAFSDRKLKSPFTNISNEHRQQPSLSSEHQGFPVPPSSHSYQPLQLKPPVDFRPENQVHSAFPKLPDGPMLGQSVSPMQQPHRPPAGPMPGYSSMPVQGQSDAPLQKPPSVQGGSVQGNMWSEFVLPPPNVELQMSKNAEMNTSKRTSSFLSDSDGLIQAQKRQKQDESDASKVTSVDDPVEKEKVDEKRKKDEKLTRRKSFSEDPAIEALVDAKVQEIMAACKEKAQTKTSAEKSRHVKSPKQQSGHVASNYDNQQVHASNWPKPHPGHQTYQAKPVQNSVYDFDESADNLNIHSKSSYKDLPHQVMDIRRYNKEKHMLKSDPDVNSFGVHHAENKFREKVKINEQLKQKVEYSNHHHFQMSDKVMSQQNVPLNGFHPNLNVNSQIKNSLNHYMYEKENNSGINELKADSNSNEGSKSGVNISEFPEKCHKSVNNGPEVMKSWNTGQFPFLPENKKVNNMNYMDKYRGVNNKKGVKVEKTPHKLKNITKIERPSGPLGITKKFGKSYGIKSSFSMHKKTPKYNNLKLPAIRKKWRNNPKYVKKPKDDFAEKLIKNLGFPPLTLKDLISRKQYKLPHGYNNGYSTIAASMLNAEDKAASRGTLPAADNNTTVSISGKNCQVSESVQSATDKSNTDLEGQQTSCAAKCQRSRSADKSSENDPQPVQRSRSWSHGMVDNGFGINEFNDSAVPQDKERMKKISEQISDLHEQVTGQDNNLERNTVIEIPNCGCPGTEDISSETIDGPYYTHLGAGRSVEAIRKTLEKRTGESGKSIRIEKVRYTGKEGKSKQGCPIAKWIVRRSGDDEKYLALVRHRVNHVCETAWLIIALVAWEGVPAMQADHLYDYLSKTLPSYGNETERRCGTNDRKTCACQGAYLMKRGASFSFGCSWSMYFNGCKFARSTHARKFRLKNEDKEEQLEDKLQALATHVGPLYQQCAPDAHANQCYYSDKAKDCRLGDAEGKPFSGVTACLDFCAHAHKDIHNMNNGSTVVVTLTKHRGLSKPEDEQLHVLPLYVLDPTDEAGSYDGQCNKLKNGSLEVLHQFPLEARMRAHPLQSCKKRRMSKRGRGGSRQTMNGRTSPWDSSSSAQSTPKKDFLQGQEALLSPASSHNNTPVKQSAMKLPFNSDKPISYDDLMSMSTQEGFSTLYDNFWDYFYSFGVFPPPAILAASLQASGEDKSLDAGNFKLNEKRQQDVPNHLTSVNALNRSSVPSNMANSQDKQKTAISQDQQHMANSQHQVSRQHDQQHMANLQHQVSRPQDQHHMANSQHQHQVSRPQDQQHMANSQHQHQVSRPQDQQHMANSQHQHQVSRPQDQQHMANSQHQHQISRPQDQQHMANSQHQHQVSRPHDQQHMANFKNDPQNSSVYASSSVQVQNPFSDPPQYYSKPPPSYGEAVNFSFQEKQPSVSSNDTHENFSTKDRPIQSGITARNETANQGSFVNGGSENKQISHQQAADKTSNVPSGFKTDSQALDLSFSSNSSKSDGLATSQDLTVPPSENWGSQSMQEPAKSLPQNHSLESSMNANRSQQSPLDLLTKAMDMRSKQVGFNGTLSHANSSNSDLQTERAIHQQGFPDKHSQQNKPQSDENKFGVPKFGHYHTENNSLHPSHFPTPEFAKANQQNTQMQNQYEQVGMNSGNPCWKPYDPNRFEFHERLDTVKTEKLNSEDASLPDPDVVKCEMQYNEEAFRDAQMGGVAIALSHRAVLFEVAKRELHATTGLKNPNRYHPTRISLVFYQHKNLNTERHGMYAYKKKLEDMKMKEMEQMQLERGYVDMQEIENSLKGGKKQKLTDEEAEIAELLKSSKAEYKFMWNCNTNRCDSNTTETVSTKWIDPSPIVTGPYQKWI